MPDSGSTHFKSKSIIISFDEYIQLRDLQTQLIISPPLKKVPEIRTKEKDLIITFSTEDTLKPNTTYVFSFGNAIVDNNEGNPKENFKYIFSTGDYIDSLRVFGKVHHAFNHKTEKDILVLLYKQDTDSSIYKYLPDYFTKTALDGSFTMTNLREGNYKIMALKDINANYKYDDNQEMVAFYDSLVNPLSATNIQLKLFDEPPPKLFLKKYNYNTYGQISFYFNKTPDSLQIHPLNHSFDSTDIVFDFSVLKDSLTYWFRNIDKDSLILKLSNGHKILDTISLKLITQEHTLKNKKKPLGLHIISSPDNQNTYDLFNDLPLAFNHLVDSVHVDDSWILQKDSLGENIVPLLHVEKIKNKIILKQNSYWLKGNTTYNLFIPPGKIIDFHGFKNDSINIALKTQEESHYGSLKLHISLPETTHTYIVQLLDESETVFREHYIHKSQTIDYLYLAPRKYKLKIIQDFNNNKKWDSGNLNQKKFPEKVIYNTEMVNVRSNWDLELSWNIKMEK